LFNARFCRVFFFIWAADGLSQVVRGGQTGWLRAAVAPNVASSPRASYRWPPCAQPCSIPAAGGLNPIPSSHSFSALNSLQAMNGLRTFELCEGPKNLPIPFIDTCTWNKV